MTETRRMFVEYTVTKVVQYMGDMEMDVPIDKLGADGSVDVDWVRDNFPLHKLDVADEDIADERLGLGDETATATDTVAESEEGGA